MVHLRLRSEYSFRRVFGRIDALIAAVPGDGPIGLADPGTWGHGVFYKAMRKKGRKPILGAELFVVEDARVRERLGGVRAAVLARNAAGLRELNELVTLANREPNFYYEPRVDWNIINEATTTGNLIFLSGSGANLERLRNRPNVFLEMNPSNRAWNRRVQDLPGWSKVVCCDNLYPTIGDKVAWEIISGSGPRGRKPGAGRTAPQHILNEYELRLAIPEATEEEFLNTLRIAEECDVEMASATMVKYPDPRPLYEMCMEGARARGMAIGEDGRLADPVYRERLDMELELIKIKNFEDYFYVITDLVQEAKRHMLVGPARGSSAGSLACYLLAITDVDPILHDLMFERFIDITRADLPDIDIDFQDDKRELVSAHLARRYGPERVGRLGTVLTYKPKSALGDVATAMGISQYEIADLKNAIIDRSSGDARAQFCILDTFEQLDIGKRMIEKYPLLKYAGVIEGHAQYSGTHAAGVIVTNLPITHYAAIDHSGCAQIDKKSAEVLNILKIDVLGLRTLGVLQDTLDQIGKDRDWLLRYPLDDAKAFDVFNEERFSGIFQYEGYALQTLTKQMKIRSFDDVAVITALARPGPLHCGAADEFIKRRTGQAPVVHLHPLVEPFTRSTYGTVIYQEQVMMIARHVGQLSWEDVQTLRRAMSKSLGDEFFGAFWLKFRDGALAQGLGEAEARGIWDKICTFGSWAFNKSHAISYGLISYWCAMLKANYPLEFAAACLRSVHNEEQSVQMLRELVGEGFRYVPVDPKRSGITWEVRDGELIGGLTNIKGMGPAKAQQVLDARAGVRPLPPGLSRLLADPRTPYDDLFPGRRRFAALLAAPKEHGIVSGPVTPVAQIRDPGEYIFLARIKEKNQRDLNEEHSKAKRGGRIIQRYNLFLNLVLEDDTGMIYGTIGRYQYPKFGKPIIESAKVGDWYLWKGEVRPGWAKVYISKCRSLETGEWPD